MYHHAACSLFEASINPRSLSECLQQAVESSTLLQTAPSAAQQPLESCGRDQCVSGGWQGSSEVPGGRGGLESLSQSAFLKGFKDGILRN